MRAKEIMREDFTNSIEDLSSTLLKSCGEIINVYKLSKIPLFRGIKTTETVLHKPIRTDRQPVEFNSTAQDMLHNKLVSMNIPVTRKNSIFCTGSGSTAKEWGNTYIVFPTNGWRAMWFNELSEETYSFYELKKLWFSVEYTIQKHNMEAGKEQFDRDLDWLFNKYPPVCTKNPQQVASYLQQMPKEILIAGPSYYAFNLKFFATSAGDELLTNIGLQDLDI